MNWFFKSISGQTKTLERPPGGGRGVEQPWNLWRRVLKLSPSKILIFPLAQSWGTVRQCNTAHGDKANIRAAFTRWHLATVPISLLCNIFCVTCITFSQERASEEGGNCVILYLRDSYFKRGLMLFQQRQQITEGKPWLGDSQLLHR